MKKLLSLLLIGATLALLTWDCRSFVQDNSLTEIENECSSADKRHKVQSKRVRKNNIKKF